ncbi:hypothetical protein DYQ86_14375 [Acidobacteria bacterium AB60]|nr:hypothetical protein DYQ86_14375 [Acidobacteria bacterium AB60]
MSSSRIVGAGGGVSLARTLGALGLGLLSGLAAQAQYSGRVTTKPKAPELRAVAVLEWTGEAGKPKSCRMVPVSIFDGEKLNDASIYMARPEPLAIAGQVEYQLKDNGKTIGLFDIKNTGQEQGSWVGYGEWKPVPNPTPAFAAKAPMLDDDGSDDKPVLHRKKHADDAPAGSSTGPASKDTSKPADDDPDRPHLHKKDDAAANTDAKPKPEEKTDTSATAAPDDPDRPVLKKPKKGSKEDEDASRSESLPQVTDPDRPRLQRGKSNADNLKVLPSLMGLPADMQQVVAVSDAQNHPDHPWVYSWANPEDEKKMKALMEDLARQVLGLTGPSPSSGIPATAPTAKTVPHRAGGVTKMAKQPSEPPAPGPELQDEQFRVFELTYGSGATMVLTADTGGPLAKEKFVTIIGQPDLYGNLRVLLKNVTDGTHLDETPHMRIVDAVDALADNRGELLFELRGETSRQFALYRVMRGRADKLFVAGGGYYGNLSQE